MHVEVGVSGQMARLHNTVPRGKVVLDTQSHLVGGTEAVMDGRCLSHLAWEMAAAQGSLLVAEDIPVAGKGARPPLVRPLPVGGATKAEVATMGDTCSTMALERKWDPKGWVDVMKDHQPVAVHCS